MTQDNHQKIDILHSMWNKNYTLPTLIITALSFMGMLWLHSSILAIIFFITGFSVFDILGFNSIASFGISEQLMSYRVIQIMMQIVMYGVIGMSCGWIAIVACEIAHWFCVCDRMFYLLQKQNFQSTDTFPWLEGWSVFLVLKIFGVKADVKSFNTMALIGTLLGIIVCLL